MKTILHPWQILILVLAGWINRQQQNSIDYLIAENQILREKLGKKRILLNDDQRRRLAIKGKTRNDSARRESKGLAFKISPICAIIATLNSRPHSCMSQV
jgi:hypothetical protein